MNFDPAIVSDSSDGYNCFRIPYDIPDIIDDTAIYSINFKRGKWDLFIGTYITKRDLYSGNLVWQIEYGLNDVNRQEVAILFYLNNDGNLEVINLLRPDPYLVLVNESIDTNPKLILTKRVFDVKSGKLLFFNNPDYNDKSLEKSRFGYFGRSNSFYLEGIGKIRKFSGIYLDTISYKVAYESTLLDIADNFKVLKKDTLQTVHRAINFGDIHFQQLPTKIEENLYLFVEKVLVKNQYQIFLRYTDSDLIIKEEYLSDIINQEVNNLSLRMISDDKLKFLFTNNVNIFDPSGERRYDILITDRKGKVLNQVRLDTKYDINYDILEWNKDNSLKLLAANYTLTENNQLFHHLDILNIDNNGDIEQWNRFFSADSLRGLVIPTVRKLSNNKFLLRFSEVSEYRMPESGNIVPDIEAQATSHMLVDGAYFGIKSNVDDYTTISSNVNLYPSITSKDVNLKFEDPFTGKIEIYSCDGILRKKIICSQSLYEKIDCIGLSNGFYLVKFVEETKKYTRPALKFVKG
jgi:hypothetical protein